MTDWLVEPDSPWVHRSGFLLAVMFWVIDLITGNAVWLITAIGIWFVANGACESWHKRQGDARITQWRVDMQRLERQLLITYRVRSLERSITPDWML